MSLTFTLSKSNINFEILPFISEKSAKQAKKYGKSLSFSMKNRHFDDNDLALLLFTCHLMQREIKCVRIATKCASYYQTIIKILFFSKEYVFFSEILIIYKILGGGIRLLDNIVKC